MHTRNGEHQQEHGDDCDRALHNNNYITPTDFDIKLNQTLA